MNLKRNLVVLHGDWHLILSLMAFGAGIQFAHPHSQGMAQPHGVWVASHSLNQHGNISTSTPQLVLASLSAFPKPQYHKYGTLVDSTPHP